MPTFSSGTVDDPEEFTVTQRHWFPLTSESPILTGGAEEASYGSTSLGVRRAFRPRHLQICNPQSIGGEAARTRRSVRHLSHARGRGSGGRTPCSGIRTRPRLHLCRAGG